MSPRLANRLNRSKDDTTGIENLVTSDNEIDPQQTDTTGFERDSVDADDVNNVEPANQRPGTSWARIVVFVLLPIVTMIAAGGVGYLRWEQWSLKSADTARVSSVQSATEATVAILSYRPDTVENDLAAAESKLTGAFRDSYATLTKDVVIPGAKQKQVSAEASVPAAAPVTASDSHAVVLVYVNQVLVMGSDAPTSTTSSVRVTLDKVDGHWLVSGFDPV